jgi:hypothetical protein
MSLKNLAEGIILQAIEDIYDDNEREGCIAFFQSKDVAIYAEMAGIDVASQVRLLDYVERVIAVSVRRQARYKVTLTYPIVSCQCFVSHPFG